MIILAEHQRHGLLLAGFRPVDAGALQGRSLVHHQRGQFHFAFDPPSTDDREAFLHLEDAFHPAHHGEIPGLDSTLHDATGGDHHLALGQDRALQAAFDAQPFRARLQFSLPVRAFDQSRGCRSQGTLFLSRPSESKHAPPEDWSRGTGMAGITLIIIGTPWTPT